MTALRSHLLDCRPGNSAILEVVNSTTIEPLMTRIAFASMDFGYIAIFLACRKAGKADYAIARDGDEWMAFCEELAGRIRHALVRRMNLVEKKMFGGVAFLLNGYILVVVWKESVIVRLGLDSFEEALRELHVKPFDITGRAMKGWVMVGADGVKSEDELKEWIERASKFVRKLPVKAKE